MDDKGIAFRHPKNAQTQFFLAQFEGCGSVTTKKLKKDTQTQYFLHVLASHTTVSFRFMQAVRPLNLGILGFKKLISCSLTSP